MNHVTREEVVNEKVATRTIFTTTYFNGIFLLNVHKEEKLENQGFALHYEDFDRMGTSGVSRKLAATDPESAKEEARLFLTTSPQLPRQTKVHITLSFAWDVSDLNVGAP